MYVCIFTYMHMHICASYAAKSQATGGNVFMHTYSVLVSFYTHTNTRIHTHTRIFMQEYVAKPQVTGGNVFMHTNSVLGSLYTSTHTHKHTHAHSCRNMLPNPRLPEAMCSCTQIPS
jgi:hypothetical protein